MPRFQQPFFLRFQTIIIESGNILHKAVYSMYMIPKAKGRTQYFRNARISKQV